MAYLASVEIDQRQSFIQQADTLREMIGASRMIEHSISIAEDLLERQYPGVELFWPVSGVLRFHSQNATDLGGFLAKYVGELEELSLTASTGVILCGSDFDEDLRKLDQKVRKRKGAKTSAVVVPTLPYFAPCQILPQFPATSWSPDEKEERSLRSWQARRREDFRAPNQPVGWMQIPHSELPELEELTPKESNSYIGILKGDVDGLGTLLAQMNFEGLSGAAEFRRDNPKGMPAAALAAETFCLALKKCLEFAVRDAYSEVDRLSKRPDGQVRAYRHLIIAGDDVLILCQHKWALELAVEIENQFGKYLKEDRVLQAAWMDAGVSRSPTISLAVLFAKVGYPFDASFDLAEEILRSAKNGRRDREAPPGEGFTDFHWLGDSARTSLKEIRRSQWFYRDYNDDPLWLTTLPWTASRLQQAMNTARDLNDKISRRKLRQLDEILRLGKDLSELAFRGWWGRLRKDEQEVFQVGWELMAEEFEDSGLPRIWREMTRDEESGYQTLLLDLVQLVEIQGK